MLMFLSMVYAAVSECATIYVCGVLLFLCVVCATVSVRGVYCYFFVWCMFLFTCVLCLMLSPSLVSADVSDCCMHLFLNAVYADVPFAYCMLLVHLLCKFQLCAWCIPLFRCIINTTTCLYD